jgi:hypothetical protein
VKQNLQCEIPKRGRVKVKVKQEAEANSANSIIVVVIAEEIMADEFAQHLEKNVIAVTSLTISKRCVEAKTCL